MIGYIIKKFIGSKNDREVKRLRRDRVPKINEFELQFQALSDDQLRAKTEEFKGRIEEGRKALGYYELMQTAHTMDAELRGDEAKIERRKAFDIEQGVLNEILPEAFAAAKNACRRLCGKTVPVRGHELPWEMVPFDVQLIGGWALHSGRISEMATGEGKTLVATMPVYLNALAGHGVHVVTVNDYLAARDSEWMGAVYKFLGLTVGCILHDQPPSVRREQYNCDITYGTNAEFGFDYLRDNGMATRAEEQVQRGHYYAIVDEVDSILIDEARTPLIISGPAVVTYDNEYAKYKPQVESLVHKQEELCADFLSKAEALIRKLRDTKIAPLLQDTKEGCDEFLREAAALSGDRVAATKLSEPKSGEARKKDSAKSSVGIAEPKPQETRKSEQPDGLIATGWFAWTVRYWHRFIAFCSGPPASLVRKTEETQASSDTTAKLTEPKPDEKRASDSATSDANFGLEDDYVPETEIRLRIERTGRLCREFLHKASTLTQSLDPKQRPRPGNDQTSGTEIRLLLRHTGNVCGRFLIEASNLIRELAREDSIALDQKIATAKKTHKQGAATRLRPLLQTARHVCAQFLREIAQLERESRQESAFQPQHRQALEREIGMLLFRVKTGFPKSEDLMKLLENPENLKVMNAAELELHADQKKVQLYAEKEELFFAIDEKSHEADLTEKGRNFLSPEDPDAFMMPDITTGLHEIDVGPEQDPRKRTELKQKLQQNFESKAQRIHCISQLLKAYALYFKDVQYVIQDNKVIIVDENTGRLMSGRRWSDGLHQAVEAKEEVEIERETQTLATITIQNYFRLYLKLSGMTGTAETEANEFFDIYKLGVLAIPTNKPIVRKDRNDSVYKTKREKFTAVINEIKDIHAQGRPILVGTISVEVSEQLSRLLKRDGIVHSVLNAKFHQQEAEIIARAGQRGSVTIATNMAGRGTDIKLGAGVVWSVQYLPYPENQGTSLYRLTALHPYDTGKSNSTEPTAKLTEPMPVGDGRSTSAEPVAKLTDLDPSETRKSKQPDRPSANGWISRILGWWERIIAFFLGRPTAHVQKVEGTSDSTKPTAHLTGLKLAEAFEVDSASPVAAGFMLTPESKVVGGLHVLATERHEARRIDRQLRGRCARQGDPGSSHFFIALEDDLMRLFGSGRIVKIMEKMGLEENQELEHPLLNRSIEQAQKRVEGHNFQIRKRTLEYDDVMNKQREIIYGFRNQIIHGEDVRDRLMDIMEEVVLQKVTQFTTTNFDEHEWKCRQLSDWVNLNFPLGLPEGEIIKAAKSSTETPVAGSVYEGLSAAQFAVCTFISDAVRKAYDLKISFEDPNALQSVERITVLSAIDRLWQEHLYEMDSLRYSIGLRAHGQRDPLIEYKAEAFKIFEELMVNIKSEICHNIFRSASSLMAWQNFLRGIPRQTLHQSASAFGAGAGADGLEASPQAGTVVGEALVAVEKSKPVHTGPKVGRNDDCPCGSGKKYKKCCLSRS